MHIKEIIVDGFKSYAHRTVIEGFDPHFNAITGLNGSGKSNILDSICFVLGITNLSQVRAGNLSELVYKQGQAGVSKASVTIVFDNSNLDGFSQSPVGYESCPEVTVTRQVLLGGKSKYTVNGRNASATQVQNLFHSVQLNVNNPHFLIMQGRITKVLNMKPNEILGMVEEAAGTRMYETKRTAALKTIEKKQHKLDELNGVLAEEITPTLERLRGEKESYLKWSKNGADAERIERFVVASEYVRARSALDSTSGNVGDLESQVSELETKSEDVRRQIQEKENEIEDMSSRMKGEFDGKLKEAKKCEEKASKDLVKASSSWQNCKNDVGKAEDELKSAKSAVEETEVAVADKRRAIQAELDASEKLCEDAREAEQRLKSLTEEYQSVSAGMSTSQTDRTLPEQIAQAHSDSKTAEAKVRQSKLKIKHLEKELKSVEKEIEKEGRSAEKLAQKQGQAKAKVADLQSKIDQLGFNPEEFAGLENEQQDLQSSISDLRNLVDTLSAQLSARLSFRYKDPVRGFDRSKVKGLVAKLVTVQNPEHSTALEVVAGGRLFQVVVDEAITGKALLERGQLERRVTIIPLDKISSKRLSRTTTDNATGIAESLQATAHPAIELVGFDEEVRSAVEYVFGSTIVVDGMKAANQICDACKTRTVTLEGDVYDPSGTISGGSKNNLGTTLSKLTELAQATQDLEAKQARMQVVDQKVAACASTASKHEKWSGQLELAETELKATEKHLSQTSYGMLVERRDAMTKELDEAQATCAEMETEKDAKWRLYEELKDQELELTQKREDRLGNMEQAVKDAKVEAAEKAKQAREAKSRSQTLSLELESLQAEVVSAQEAVTAAEKALSDASNEEEEVQMKLGEIRAVYEQAKRELDSLEERMTHCSAELLGLKNQKAALVKAAEASKLEVKKLSITISRIRKERATAEKVVSSLVKNHPWIESEKSAFGVRGGDYDFEATDPSEAARQLKELKAEQELLAKKINKKVMGMIEKAEGEYTELLRKRKVVENDKKKIQAVIEELDEKKKTELQRTWVKVNTDFGSIFSTLLPGASAKLEPPEGMEAWEGLEVKVAFGEVWKESLSELSGGQRSLLALSLILSLLLFKPAPMYILDEVDAALDLSHTQNIGSMLKTHFSQSQFIVVSLKEGMFNNANVIFRTKFVDGVSTVARTMGTGSSRNQNQNALSDTAAAKGRGGNRRAANNQRKGKENTASAVH